jgi:hypothetical protein
MRKAQTEAITLVLISGIVISLVGFALTWGQPMIQKRSAITQFTSAVRFMEDLDKKIVNMAGACSSEGACEETMDLPVPGLIILNESSNTILYEFDVNQPLITRSEVLFNTVDNGTVARYGETPGVISFRGQNAGTNTYTLIFSLRYRELDSSEPWKGYKIQLLNQSGRLSGNSKIIISYGNPETRAGQAHNGGDLVVSKIRVQPL